MPSIWTTAVVVLLVVAAAVAENSKFCKQDEKQLANKLHEQNTEPAKSCYRAANGDITTLATSRLCSLPECLTWLEYMAANSPDCYFDSNNYATIYAAKSADCTGGTSTSASGSASSSASLRSSSSGSQSSASLGNGIESSSRNSNSLSAMSEDRDLNTTASRSSSIGGSAVGDMSRSDTMGSRGVEADVTTAPTPTPTEDLTLQDASASTVTDSSNSTTPTPTSSASSAFPTLSSVVACIVVLALVGIE
ncbi:hypothetical protein PHYPSEUDO_002479 [Phytophthora pseudosyringae]|uniref:Elicitin-like protein n=1 Tax=Phytophthora pseudosyringae TaxID=221518 RepID=A0A8T1VX56_9STRA|nr:hypothetical protein PHYPSEUDO_002479 [Phytophthora pseudosyringae]